MTILNAIQAADLLRPNDLPPELKVHWLSSLDGQLDRTLCQTHDPAPPPLAPYGEDTDLEATRLLAPAPFDGLYLDYLVMRICLAQGALEDYNTQAVLFNQAQRAFARDYGKSHTPKGVNTLAF